MDSVFQISYGNYDVVMVDNGAEDESIDVIHAYLDGQVTLKLSNYNSDLTEPNQIYPIFEARSRARWRS